jgi:hypothetical protein
MAWWIEYVKGLPLMYMFVGVTVAFAVIATGLLRYTEWRQRVNRALKIVEPPV